MKAHDPIHRQTWDLIPWLVNDTLDDVQRALAESHLRECADCREELAFQRRVQAGILEDAPTVEAVSPVSMARFFERIDAEDAAYPSGRHIDPLSGEVVPPAATMSRGGRRPRLAHLLAAAVIVEAIGLIGLGTMLAGQRSATDAASNFVTLSQDVQPATGARIRLVPSPTLSVAELQSLLGAAGLRIVESNAGGTILALGFAAPETTATVAHAPEGRRVEVALQRLRENSGVLLAEPILASAPTSP